MDGGRVRQLLPQGEESRRHGGAGSALQRPAGHGSDEVLHRRALHARDRRGARLGGAVGRENYPPVRWAQGSNEGADRAPKQAWKGNIACKTGSKTARRNRLERLGAGEGNRTL